MPSEQPAPETQTHRWFLRGVAAAFSIPALILATAFIGFAGLARDAGLTLAQTLFMTGMVWALPAKVVLVGAILSGASLPAAALAVTLSSVRLMPMVVALLPELRGPRTPRWVLYALSHFVAVTSWVLALERLPALPREARTAYYAGLGGALILGNMAVVAVFFLVATALPPAVSAALFMLTPVYFLTSLWSSARELAGHLAMAFGIVLGPLFHLIVPGFELLLAGAVGGVGAWLLHRRVNKGRAA